MARYLSRNSGAMDFSRHSIFAKTKNFIGYIRDSNGIEYDPRLSPEFATVSSVALSKLQPFAAEIANPDSAITRLITGQWPRITGYTRIDFDSGGQALPPKYASNDYDMNMNFGPTPPPEVSAPPDNVYSPNYPIPSAVHEVKLRTPLTNSIDKLKGKVSFDEGDIEIAEIPYVFDIKMKRIAHSYKLRICKNVDAGPT